MLSRRALVGKLAVGVTGAAVAWAASPGRARAALTRSEPNMDTSTGNGAAGLAPAPAEVAAVELAPSSPVGVTDAGVPPAVGGPPPWELLRPLALHDSTRS